MKGLCLSHLYSRKRANPAVNLTPPSLRFGGAGYGEHVSQTQA